MNKEAFVGVDPLSDFQEGQWWVAELDAMAGAEGTTHDQKRAVAVVHHMLRSAERSCNSHDQLVAALKIAQQGLNQVGVMDHLVDYDFNRRVLSEIRAALAAAGEKS